MNVRTRDRLIQRAKNALMINSCGLPECRDNKEIYAVMTLIEQANDADLSEIANAFLIDAGNRAAEHIEPLLMEIAATTFSMGTAAEDARHFSGEVPLHSVDLAAYRMASTAVTNELFGLLDPTRIKDLDPRELHHPVVNVSWFDAWVFAAWVGCRLPTEAEWEYACGLGSAEQWCCPQEQLVEYAWFSENSGSVLWPTQTREPNSLGLYDMHGNAWEWCQDSFHTDSYRRTPQQNPVYGETTEEHTHKVNRGGGFLALPEMCRTRYRMHDPAHTWAMDLGFRLADSRATDPED